MSAAGAIPLRQAPTNVATLLRSIRQVMEPQARAHDVTLGIETDDDVPATIVVDPHKIAWALTALVGNALRYVRHGTSRMPGGSITVRASRDAAPRAVAITVQDDGPGIPPESVRHLTDPDGDDSRGLALAMIRDVVVAHGGTFDIRSETGAFNHGTTVRLTLPAA